MLQTLKVDRTYFLPIVTLALLYFFAAKLSFTLMSAKLIVDIGLFPSEGIALAFALYFGRPVVWGIFIGQLVLALSNDVSFMPALFIALINSLEALLGITIFEKFHLDTQLKRWRDIIGLALAILLILQPFSALLANFTLYIYAHISMDELFHSTFSCWFGNIMGQLLFTPFTLILLHNYKTINFREFFLYGLSFGFYVYFLEFVIEIKSLLLLLSCTIPFIIFIISKKGISFGLLFSVILALCSSYALYNDVGAFAHFDHVAKIIDYNLFMLTNLSLALTTAIIFEHKRQLEIALQKKLAEEIEKNKEQQLFLMQQSRLAQMGEMISMIAHQWRQPLNNLSLANQLLIMKYKKGKLDDGVVEYFSDNSKKQIDLMSQTIDSFRDFFKAGKKKEKFCVNELIESILDMTKVMYTANGIHVTFNADGTYYIEGYSNELGQALLNILNNAKDALNDAKIKNKEIHIKLYEEDAHIVIVIHDNAGGIDEAIIEKIFDPYFTTKESKNGTGLGLYMTRMIIQEKFHAKLAVSNEEDGATFTIYLPKGENFDA